MSEKILREIVSELGSIYSKIPSEAKLDRVENKLDKMIALMEEQNEISDSIVKSLDKIADNIPRESGLTTHKIEASLEKIWDRLDDLNVTLHDIYFNISG